MSIIAHVAVVMSGAAVDVSCVNSLAVDGAGQGAMLCSIAVSSMVPDQKMLAVPWL
jgi:hypothetical protein